MQNDNEDPFLERLKNISFSKQLEQEREKLLRSDYPSKLFQNLIEYITKKIEKYRSSGVDFTYGYYERGSSPYNSLCDKQVNHGIEPYGEIGEFEILVFEEIYDEYDNLACSGMQFAIEFHGYVVILDVGPRYMRYNEGYEEYGIFEPQYNQITNYHYILTVWFYNIEKNSNGRFLLDYRNRKMLYNNGFEMFFVGVNKDLTPSWDKESNTTISNKVFSFFAKRAF